MSTMRLRPTPPVVALAACLVSTAPLAALDIDSTVLEMINDARRAERRGAIAEARALCRAASACYRYWALPIRLAQLDFFHEFGLLERGDPAAMLDRTSPLAVLDDDALGDDYLAAREKLEAYYERRADVALDLAVSIEARMDTRSMGFVPLEPTAALTRVEALFDAVVRDGAAPYLLVHGFPEIAALAKSSAPRQELARIKREWRERERYLALAADADYSARLVRECALAFARAQLESLALSVDHDTVARMRARVETLAKQSAEHAASAGRYYLAAAAALTEEGNVTRAVVYTERARSFGAVIPAPDTRARKPQRRPKRPAGPTP